MSSSWQRSHLEMMGTANDQFVRVYTSSTCRRVLPDLYLWDPWPVLSPEGAVVQIDGVEVWMTLAADSSLEPDQRHDVARIRLLSYAAGAWRDHGWLFNGESPGSREWAGSAVYNPVSRKLEVCYTATGLKGEEHSTFIQRMYHAYTELTVTNTSVSVGEWSDHRLLVEPGNVYRSTEDQFTGEAGFIKAFRDPSRFVDPKDDALYILFTASLIESDTDFDGVVGAARGTCINNLSVLPPLLHADGVNNELERPHIIYHEGLYYLFFSTQARTFHPDVSGPTGLYGFVAECMDGEWSPLNDSGLVLANPPEEPFQAYSWLVLEDLSVTAFLDFPNLHGALPEDVQARGEAANAFAGTIAPRERISITGDRTRLLMPD